MKVCGVLLLFFFLFFVLLLFFFLFFSHGFFVVVVFTKIICQLEKGLTQKSLRFGFFVCLFLLVFRSICVCVFFVFCYFRSLK